VSAAGRDRGALAIVLHTHMPYVEGFGTWPFGEEWLWEAIAGCYLPLVELLDEGAPLTLSLTPVLCDQLEAPQVAERFAKFVGEVRRWTHEEDAAGLRAAGHTLLADELDRSWGDYEGALESLRRRSGDLLGALGRHAQWTSAATHAVLPLVATDAGVGMQAHTGIAAHRRRFGEGWRGGFWLPECAYAPWLARTLEQAGVRAVCVELTNRFGLGAVEHLRPLMGDSGVVVVPIDRATVSLVWSDDGYPAAGAYRDYHHHTIHHHNPWSNDGGAYDRDAALALAGEHAADFVARTIARLRAANESAPAGAALPHGGLVVCALDTELLGHWWYEGPHWLRAVVQECSRQGLQLLRLDDALERGEPTEPGRAGRAGLGRTELGRAELGRGERPGDSAHPAGSAEPIEQAEVCSWGAAGDLSTWSGPTVAEMAFAMRAAELEVLAAGDRAGAAAVRELLALQASDWPFMVSRAIAVPYARERFDGHRRALATALAAGPHAETGSLRNLARDAEPIALRAPI
jgi:1,4-alpha-glucan branching enzyme